MRIGVCAVHISRACLALNRRTSLPSAPLPRLPPANNTFIQRAMSSALVLMPTAPTAFGTGMAFTAAILPSILLCALATFGLPAFSSRLVVVVAMPTGFRMRSRMVSPQVLPDFAAMILPATMYSRLS
jgi:hypothetical protein